MKLIALSANKSLMEFLTSNKKTLKSELSIELVIEPTAIKAIATRGADSCFYLIDLDHKKEAALLRKELLSQDNFKWIAVSEILGPKDFRKMQMEDFAPDALFKLPLEADDFLDTLKSMLGSFQGTMPLDDTKGGESGLNFLGMADVLKLHDDESDDEGINLPIKELKLNQDVKLTLNEHNTSGEINEALSSQTNARIQNKFDLAFTDDDSLNLNEGQLDFDENDDDLSLGLLSNQTGKKENHSISLNLNTQESTSGSSPATKILPGLNFVKENLESATRLKVENIEDDIGKLNITSTGIKFNKMSSSSKSKDLDNSDEVLNFKIDEHQVDSIVDKDESDINLSFNNIPDQPPAIDESSFSLGHEDIDFNLDENSSKDNFESNIDGPLDINFDLEGSDDDATIVTKSNLPSNELPQIELTADDEYESSSIELTNESKFEEDSNKTMATVIDSQLNIKKSGTNEVTDLDLDNSFNEFKSNIDQTHQEVDIDKEHFTIDMDLLSDNDQSFNLDEEKTSSARGINNSQNVENSRHENLEEQVRDRNLYMDDLGRLKATIHDLREEREAFNGKINKLESENESLKTINMTAQAELEELKAEIKLIHSRQNMRVEDLRKEIDLLHDKKILIEEKNKSLRNEISKLEQKLKIDMNQIRQREKELEGQLDLVKMDTESQVYTRDSKILELKKKIDALEFNMENMAIKEQKVLEDKIKLEERLNKIMSTLRGSIQVLEEDVDIDQDI